MRKKVETRYLIRPYPTSSIPGGADDSRKKFTGKSVL